MFNVESNTNIWDRTIDHVILSRFCNLCFLPGQCVTVAAKTDAYTSTEKLSHTGVRKEILWESSWCGIRSWSGPFVTIPDQSQNKPWVLQCL